MALKKDVAKEVLKLMVEKEVTKGTMAERCGWSSSNFYNKVKRNNFSLSELEIMANALDCDVDIEFIPKNNNE